MGVIADAGRNVEGAPGTRTRVVSAAVVRAGHILLAQRSFDTSFPLAWCTPGGKVEPGESDAVALRRELQEELGLALGDYAPMRAVFDVALDPPTVGRPVRVTCYRIEWSHVAGLARPGDGTVGLGWFDASTLSGLHLTPSDRASREKLVAALRPDPLLSVRASGDAGHDDGCSRDHVIPGVCVPAGEEASDAR